MRWLIYGHRGWIGGQVVEYLKEKYPEDEVILGQARLENYNDLTCEVIRSGKGLKYGEKLRIMSFTGRTHGPGFSTIDYLEQPGNLAINLRDNLYGPLNLALIVRTYGKISIHYTYLGTGCIYKYDEDHPLGSGIGFTEEDKPNFVGSGYSTVKGFTDQYFERFWDEVLNVRIRMPIIGENSHRNFITKIVNYEKVVNIPNSMTVLPDMIPIMIQMARKGETGTYNFTNPGVISHNQILDMYQELVDPSFRYVNFTEEEQNKILAAERSNNYLDTTKLEEYCKENNLELLKIEDSVRKILENFRTESK